MDHIIKATEEDELGMDNVREIDGIDENNTALLQRVSQGHFTEWNKMRKVNADRKLYERFQRLDPETKTTVETTIKMAEDAVKVEIGTMKILEPEP